MVIEKKRKLGHAGGKRAALFISFGSLLPTLYIWLLPFLSEIGYASSCSKLDPSSEHYYMKTPSISLYINNCLL